MEKTQRYVRIELKNDTIPQALIPSRHGVLRDVDAVPKAGTIDMYFPLKDGSGVVIGAQIVSVPWCDVKVAVRLPEGAN